jgi:gluconokinase
MSAVLDEVLEGFEPSPELVSVMAGSKTPAVLALDIGTSGVRASLFDQRGNEMDGARVRFQTRHSAFDHLTDADADSTVSLVAETIDALLDKPHSATHRIELIAVSCFWHSLVGVDREGVPTTSILGWADTRGISAVKELRNRFDETEIHLRTGCRFHPSYWPAKLLLLKEQPEIYRSTSRWLSFSDYLVLRLFGETITSVSMASATGLFNQRSLQWDGELIGALDIPGETLPEVSCPDRTLQDLTAEYAERWPQLRDAQALLPIGDGAANTIGSGCTTRDNVALMIGTSGAMRVLYKGEPPNDLPSALWCYRADQQRVVVGGALSDGGGLYRWIRESLLASEDPQSIETQLSAMEPDAHGLTVLPFWAGERSTGWSADARGAIIGLTLQTQPIEILRAAMEGIAYRFALIAKALEPFASGASIIASGNALRSSHTWTQMIADVLGQPVSLSCASEASARGAALLALEAMGRIDSIEAFQLSVDTRFEPNLSHHERYQQGIERQLKFYESVIG